MTDFERRISAAQGYMELGMLQDAIAELDGMDAGEQQGSAVIELRLLVLMRAKLWSEALPLGYELCRLHPDSTAGFVHAAFCLHELGRTREAKEVLLAGPHAMQDEPTYFYNLACYDLALGDKEQALRNVERSFRLDKRYRDFAMVDPDLAAIRHLL